MGFPKFPERVNPLRKDIYKAGGVFLDGFTRMVYMRNLQFFGYLVVVGQLFRFSRSIWSFSPPSGLALFGLTLFILF